MLTFFNLDKQVFSMDDDEGNGVAWEYADILAAADRQPETIINCQTFFKEAMDEKRKEFDSFSRMVDSDINDPIILGTGDIVQSIESDFGKRFYKAPIILSGLYPLLKSIYLGRKYIGVKVVKNLPPPMVRGIGIQLFYLHYKLVLPNEKTHHP